MVALSAQKIFLIFLLASLAPAKALSQQSPPLPQQPRPKVQRYTLPPNPKARFRFPTNKSAANAEAVKAYRRQAIAEKEQRMQRLAEERYAQYLEHYNEVQKRAQTATKPRKKKVLAAPTKETPQQIARKKRLRENKEILEGTKPPTAQDDPYYVQFMAEIERLTFGKD